MANINSEMSCSICYNDYNGETCVPFFVGCCGQTYCQNCLSRFEICPGCRGLIQSKNINRFALNLISSITFKNNQLKLKSDFDHINETLTRFETGSFNNPELFLLEYFNKVKGQVCLHRDQVINQSQEILNKIDALEKETKKNIKMVPKVDVKNLKSTIIPEWHKMIKNPQITADKVNNLLNDVNKSTVSLEKSINQYESRLLMKMKLKFEPFEKIFGRLYVIRRINYRNGIYEGELNDDMVPHGKGEWQFNDNCIKYIGDWINGKRHGKGTLYLTSGKHYVGDFKDGKISGRGILYYRGQIRDRFEGDFSNNSFDGTGVMYYTDGRIERKLYQNGVEIEDDDEEGEDDDEEDEEERGPDEVEYEDYEMDE